MAPKIYVLKVFFFFSKDATVLKVEDTQKYKYIFWFTEKLLGAMYNITCGVEQNVKDCFTTESFYLIYYIINIIHIIYIIL